MALREHQARIPSRSGYFQTVHPHEHTEAVIGGPIEATRRYAAAINAGDRAALDALLDPDHHFASGHGRVFERAERLDALLGAAKGLSSFTIDVIFSSSDGVRTAIVLADFTARFQTGTVGRGLTTLVFHWTPDSWLLRHQHNSHHVD